MFNYINLHLVSLRYIVVLLSLAWNPVLSSISPLINPLTPHPICYTQEQLWAASFADFTPLIISSISRVHCPMRSISSRHHVLTSTISSDGTSDKFVQLPVDFHFRLWHSKRCYLNIKRIQRMWNTLQTLQFILIAVCTTVANKKKKNDSILQM